MPGSSRVNGAWRTATGLSVKVSGQWRTATSAFIKVGGQWRQWFASKIQDAFNRASTSLGLGTADSGQIWSALRGNWRISGSNTAVSDDSASSYPIASVNLGSSDVKVQVDTSGGTGVAFWVSDAGSWWASYPLYSTSSSTTPVTGSCFSGSRSVTVQRSACYTSTSSPCNVQSSSSAGACAGPFGGGTACTGSASCSFQGSSGTCSPSGSCCSGTSCSNSTSQETVFGCSFEDQKSCGGLNCSLPGGFGNCCGGTINVNVSSTITSCPQPGCTFNGQTITVPGSTYFELNDGGSCFGVAPPGASVQQVSCSNCGGCPTGGFVCCRVTTASSTTTCSGCTTQTNYATWCSLYETSTTVTTTTRTCTCGTLQNQPQYWLVPGSPQCNTGISYCFGSGCNPGGCCSGVFDVSYSETICDQSPRSCSGSGCNPGSCCSGISYSGGVTTTTYTTQLVIVSSVSNNVISAATTTISSNTSGFTNVGSVYVSTNGSAIAATAYSSANLGGTALTTLNHAPSNPTRGTSVGIIKGPSSANQGSTVDNFLATI